MKYLSLFSGIEAATVAWHSLGWQPIAFAEIEPFPCAVLAHHYPSVPNLGDVTKHKEWNLDAVDLLVGGSPCQAFSVAGLRKGLDDPRGNLTLTYLAVVDQVRPRWVVWENVPGVLSSVNTDHPDEMAAPDDLQEGEERECVEEYDADSTHALSCFLDGLTQLGYGWSMRVLDAQYAGVPQRRRRVFVVGYLGDWRPAAAVLLERHSLSGNPPPSREARARVAAGLTRGAESSGKGGYAGRRREDDVNIVMAHGQASAEIVRDGEPSLTCNHEAPILAHAAAVAAPITHNPYGDHESRESLLVAHSLRAEGFDASEDGTGRGTLLVPVAVDLYNQTVGDVASTVTAPNGGGGYHNLPAVAYRTSPNCGAWETGDRTDALTTGTDPNAHVVAYTVSSANSCEKESHARPSSVARCLDQTGGFAPQQGGTVVAQAIPIDMRQASRGATMTNNRNDGACSGGAPGTGIGEEGDPSPSISQSHPPAVATPFAFQTRCTRNDRGMPSDVVPALTGATCGGHADTRPHVGGAGMAVRRLTPRECEALQGFPRDYTLIPFRGKPAADGPRYRALGNSMAVPVMRWLAERIEMVEDILKTNQQPSNRSPQ
jgi:DNA (cytosine-5)-methyltransferase 1